MMRSLIIIFLFFYVCPVVGQYKDQVKSLDRYFESSRKDWKMPGMAVAVIKDGEVLLSKGYGERELGKGEKVDSQTIFNIGSTTKAFTAAAVGILVDEGKLRWDDPVSKYLPELQLYDPYTTRDMRVRDLLTHNLGLPSGDFLWYFFGYEPAETLRRMRYLEPTYPLRGGYTYQNNMYIAAGELIKAVSGKSWEDFIEEKIFKPLGMNNSYPNLERSKTQTNRSVPHAWKYGEEQVVAIEDKSFDNAGPAGTIWSCVDDMALWISAMMDSSKYDGGKLLRPLTWVELFKPHTNIPKNQFYPTHRLTNPKWTSYALGWFQQDYNGRGVDFHTGSIDGTIALAGMIRSEGIGYYFLGNLDHAEVRHALMYKTFDVMTSDGDRDWSEEMKSLYGSTTQRQQAAIARMNDRRMEGTKPDRELKHYTGVYTSELWGKITVELNGDQLQITSPMNRQLVHWHYNTFHIPSGNQWQGPMVLLFNLAPDGNVGSVSIGGSDVYKFYKGRWD